MYKIIGNDGKSYGPATAAQIMEWIAEGRVESRTAVLYEGSTEWTFLGLLPEFASKFSGGPPIIAPNKIGAMSARSTNSFANAGLICGIVSCICCCGCPFNILGLIFSIIALAQINTQVEKQDGWGIATIGLICSAASLVFSFGLWFFENLNSPANIILHLSSF